MAEATEAAMSPDYTNVLKDLYKAISGKESKDLPKSEDVQKYVGLSLIDLNAGDDETDESEETGSTNSGEETGSDGETANDEFNYQILYNGADFQYLDYEYRKKSAFSKTRWQKGNNIITDKELSARLTAYDLDGDNKKDSDNSNEKKEKIEKIENKENEEKNSEEKREEAEEQKL